MTNYKLVPVEVKSKAQIAFENMRRHFVLDKRAWTDLTEEQKEEWQDDVSARPHLYDLSAAPEPVREPEEQFELAGRMAANLGYKLVRDEEIGAPYSPDPPSVSGPCKLNFAEVRSKLSAIVECSRALRQGGPEPEDLEELSDSLDKATGLADDILAYGVWADPAQPLSNTQDLDAAPVVGEPVAWRWSFDNDLSESGWFHGHGVPERPENAINTIVETQPLYTRPDPKLDVAVKALKAISDMTPSTCETSLAHDQGQIAFTALAQIKGGA